MTVGGAVLPILVPADEGRGASGLVRDNFLNGLAVAYSFGPPYGRRLVSQGDLSRLGVTLGDLRRLAAGNLSVALEDAELHGEAPYFLLSFNGLETSAILDRDFWDNLRGTVPGEVVVGVPARDVVIVTGTWAEQGMARLRRAVDRVFFAGGQNLLTRDLLVWRRSAWEVLRTSDPRSAVPAPNGPRR